MPAITNGEIVFNNALAQGFYQLRVHAPELTAEVEPGQFVQVKVRPGFLPLLRTPISVHDAQPEEGLLDLLYRVVGDSTELLSQLQPGGLLDLVGPLGHGFSLPPAGHEAWLLAGGIGVAPLFYLARQLRARGYVTRLFYGVRTAAELVRLQDFRDLGVSVETCTDDGSCGLHGNVLQLAQQWELPAACQLYACGPRPMLKAVDDFAVLHQLPAELSLEEYMACGIGACLGCACATKSGGFAHVCTDGPVFRGGELKL